MVTRYQVTLTPEQRASLESLTKTGKHDSRTVFLGRALLLCDKSPGGPAWPTKDICAALGLSDRTIERAKKRFVEDGLDQVLNRQPLDTSRRDIKFDSTFEAKLLALACSPPPTGRSRWTIRLLADKTVELNYIDSVSAMSIQRLLKKMKFCLTSENTSRSPKGKPPS